MAAAGPVPAEPQPGAVFLSFPYDRQFVPLYLAYITGVCSFGLTRMLRLSCLEENGVWIESWNSSLAVVIRSTICPWWNWIFAVPGRPV